jgi:hypothetical protein
MEVLAGQRRKQGSRHAEDHRVGVDEQHAADDRGTGNSTMAVNGSRRWYQSPMLVPVGHRG